MRYLILILSMLVFSVGAQNNLIFNGSFEEFTPPDLDPVEDKVFLQAGSFQVFEFTENITCWNTKKDDGGLYSRCYFFIFSSEQPLYSPATPFAPTADFWAERYSFYISDLPNLFEDIYNSPGYNILSPYSEISPTNGNAYLALVSTTIEYQGNFTNGQSGASIDGTADDAEMLAYLKDTLVKNKVYTFKVDLRKIYGLNELASDNETNPKVKIRLKKSNGIFYKNLYTGYISDHVNWESKSGTIEVNTDGYDQVHIKLNRKLNKNSGVYIDDFQLYDACVTDSNTCENPELFKPLLSIDLHQIEFDTTITNSSFVVKTIEIKNLEVANHATITITDMSGNSVYRSLFEGENPPAKLMWDGKNDAGDMMPDGWYKCTVVASNLCYGPETYTKKFKKESAIQVFQPIITQNADGGITISEIYDAELASVYVEHVLTEVTAFIGVVVKPENEIGWNGMGGTNETQIVTPNLLPSGQYRVSVYLKSNCGAEIHSETFFINEFQIALMYLNGAFDDPLYHWGVVPDKIIPPCDFFVNDEAFYRVPKNCCVGDLYLSDETLWGDMTFNILGTIHIDQSVVFEEGSTIVMNAGEGFHLTPDSNSVTLGSDVHLHVGTECEPCDCNKSAYISTDSSVLSFSDRPVSIDTLALSESERKVMIAPNPTSDYINVVLSDNVQFQSLLFLILRGKLNHVVQLLEAIPELGYIILKAEPISFDWNAASFQKPTNL